MASLRICVCPSPGVCSFLIASVCRLPKKTYMYLYFCDFFSSKKRYELRVSAETALCQFWWVGLFFWGGNLRFKVGVWKMIGFGSFSGLYLNVCVWVHMTVNVQSSLKPVFVYSILHVDSEAKHPTVGLESPRLDRKWVY